jgi:hypothetical protein
MPTIVVIKPDQSVTPVTPANGKSLSLDEMQKHVGGYIQRVTFKGVSVILNCTKFTSGEMYVDEDGISKGLPINLTASAIFGAKILGNALVLFRKGKRLGFGNKPEERTVADIPEALRTRPESLRWDINGNRIKE